MASTERLEAAAEAVLLVALVLAPWPYGCAQDVLRYALVALVASALVLFGLGRAAAGRALPALTGPALALPALGLLQVALRSTAAPVFTVEAALVLATLLLAAAFWSERARARAPALRLALAALVCCGAQAAFAALQWSRAPDQLYGRTLALVTMPFGSYVNHNHFANLVVMGTLLAAGLALGHAQRARGVTPQAVAAAGLSLALAATLIASRSRGALVALVVGLSALGFGSWARARRRKTAAWLAPLLGLGLLAFALLAVPAETRRHLGSLLRGTGDQSASYRLDVARDTLRLAAAYPLLGSGLGAYADAFPAYKRAHGDVRTTHAESDALELLAEAGLLGLVALAWFARCAGRAAWERLRDGHDPLRRGLLLGVIAALAAVLTHACFDFALRLPANALLAASLLGLAAAPRGEARAGRRAAAAAFAALAFALCAAAAWRGLGARHLERARAQPQPLLRLAGLDELVATHPFLDRGWAARGVLRRELALPGSVLRAARLSGSASDLRTALRLRPAWALGFAELGHTLWLAGDAQAAQAALERAQALDPTDAGIALLRAHVLAAQGDVRAAVRVLAELLERAPDWTQLATAQMLRFSQDALLLAPLAGADPARQALLERALEQARRP